MDRYLGLDYGKKRIGVALSDPLGMFASGLTTIEGRSEKDRLAQVVALIDTHQVRVVVLGLPRKTTGELGDLAETIQVFGQKLTEQTDVSVLYEDERYTSKIAEQALREAGKQPSRQKGLIDQTAAALILQQVLDKKAMS